MGFTETEFRSLIRERGYTLADLARLWGLSRGRLTQLAGDPDRPKHYDYAVWGLPPKALAPAIRARRARYLAALMAGHKLPRRRSRATPWTGANVITVPTEVEARIQVGDTVSVLAEQGDHLPEGLGGIVTTVIQKGDHIAARIRFRNGYEETFDLTYLLSPASILWLDARREPEVLA